MKKSIAVIGQGFVGGSLTTVFSECDFNVYTYDKAGKASVGSKNTFQFDDAYRPAKSVAELVKICAQVPGFTNIFFVCLPTPMFEDGEADLSIVEGVLTELSACPGERIAVVKSTVPPGSTEYWNKKYADTGLHVVFNPEFLTEANALNDMRNQNRIILGGPRPWINEVKMVFQTAFPGVPLIKTSSTTAEMVKYVTNCFLATKVSFANEMAQICNALDGNGFNVDYDKVVEYAKYDKRLGDSHWAVPGPVATHDGRYVKGFGGHCFPKDLNALRYIAKKHCGVDTKVLDGVWEKNLEIRPPEDRDWEHMQGRAVSKKQGLKLEQALMRARCSTLEEDRQSKQWAFRLFTSPVLYLPAECAELVLDERPTIPTLADEAFATLRHWLMQGAEGAAAPRGTKELHDE